MSHGKYQRRIAGGPQCKACGRSATDREDMKVLPGGYVEARRDYDDMIERKVTERLSGVNRAVANSPPPCADVGDDVTFMMDEGMGMMKGEEIMPKRFTPIASHEYPEDMNPHVVETNRAGMAKHMEEQNARVLAGAKRKVAAMEWPLYGKDLNPPVDAVKFDVEKPIFDLLPFDALAEISRVLEFGSEKYGARNWEKGFKWLRLANAAARHLFAWMRGENKDAETGYSHVAHLACCALFLLAHELREVGVDDRR